jgi:thymidylate synthase
MNIEHDYLRLLKDILDNGVQKQDRTGTGTISVFGRQIRHKMSEGFPLLTTKKMPFKTMVTELLWFLRGDTNIKYLVDNNCHIWDGDAYKNYLFNSDWHPISSVNGGFIGTKTDSDEIMTQEEFINKIKTNDEFAKKWGELGPIYGKQWRSWGNFFYDNPDPDGDGFRHLKVDQITNLINDLKTNPDSRRLMVNAWNVGELDQMVLPPCHYGFQVYTRELSAKERWDWYGKNGGPYEEQKLVALMVYEDEEDNSHIHSWLKTWAPNVPTRAISLMWNQRSVDTFLGLPFNIASYGLLLEIIAKEVNMVPDELVGNLGDVHLYLNHIEQAKEQIGRDLTEDERYELVTQQMSKLRAITDEDYIKYNIPNRTREPYPLPKLGEIPDYLCMKDNWECYEPSDFTLENYESHPTIKAPLSN